MSVPKNADLQSAPSAAELIQIIRRVFDAGVIPTEDEANQLRHELAILTDPLLWSTRDIGDAGELGVKVIL